MAAVPGSGQKHYFGLAARSYTTSGTADLSEIGDLCTADPPSFGPGLFGLGVGRDRQMHAVLLFGWQGKGQWRSMSRCVGHDMLTDVLWRVRCQGSAVTGIGAACSMGMASPDGSFETLARHQDDRG